MAALLEVLSPHAVVFRREQDDGASVTLTVAGEVRGDVVDNVQEAERRHIEAGAHRELLPLFDVDRVGIGLSEPAIAFLAACGAQYASHIDVEYQRPTKLEEFHLDSHE